MIPLTYRRVPAKPGVYEATVDERVLCRSRQPLYDGARVLMREGANPGEVIEARHEGGCVSMRVTVRYAAMWTVSDKGPRILRGRWQPFAGIKAVPA